MSDSHSQDAGRLAGKTAFVTGGARGIGHAMVVDTGFLVKTS